MGDMGKWLVDMLMDRKNKQGSELSLKGKFASLL